MKKNIIFILIALAISGGVHANSTQGEKYKITKRFSEENNYDSFIIKHGVENKIRILLGKNYEKFKINFQVTGRPFNLKDGGTFFEGWRKNYPYEHSAAILSYPDGRLYISIYNSEKKYVEYFGPEREPIPKVIKIWSLQFGPKLDNHQIEGQDDQSKLKIFKDENIASEASVSQRIASSIWQPSILAGIDYNDDVMDVIAVAQQEIFTCSQESSWVPDPSFIYPSPLLTLSDLRKYLIKYFDKVIDNNKKISRNHRYKVCIDSTALNYKTALLAASYGL